MNNQRYSLIYSIYIITSLVYCSLMNDNIQIHGNPTSLPTYHEATFPILSSENGDYFLKTRNLMNIIELNEPPYGISDMILQYLKPELIAFLSGQEPDDTSPDPEENEINE